MDREELKKYKDEFLGLLRSTGIEEIDDFINELENTEFFKAPASMNGHLCYEGGLMIHSLNVYYAARRIRDAFADMRPDVFEKISDESLIIASLLHDMCKADLYVRKREARQEFGQSQYSTTYGSLPMPRSAPSAGTWGLGASTIPTRKRKAISAGPSTIIRSWL